jgi:excisionase family DNA binding protein
MVSKEATAPEFLTAGEVALRLRMRPDAVRRKIRRGEIPAIRLGTGRRAPLRVPTEEFEQWLYANAEQA